MLHPGQEHRQQPQGGQEGAELVDEVDALGGFLETTALVADSDAWDTGVDRVALMTFHAAKGLEFPVVYLVAMEDGILPHERSIDHPDQLEEERRLVFVGITRAREQVHASSARMRDYRGTRRISALMTHLNWRGSLPIKAQTSKRLWWLDMTM